MIRKAAILTLTAALVFGLAGAGFGQEAEKDGQKTAEKTEEKALTFGFESDFNSKYIWRSLAFSEGAVWQPSGWVSYAGFNFELWSNFVLGREPNRRQFNEIDYRLSYAVETGAFTIEPAVTIYDYPNQDKILSPTTGEAEVKVAYGLGDFSLETTHFLDFWSNKGGYVGELGLEYEKEAGQGLTVAAAARLVFANAKFNSYYVADGLSGGFNSLVLEAGLTWALGGGFTVRPHVELNTVLSGSLRDAIRVSDWISLRKPDLFNFGVAIGYSFE